MYFEEKHFSFSDEHMTLITADVTMARIPVWQICWLINFKELCLNGFSIGNVWGKFDPLYLLSTWMHQNTSFLNVSS